ncbi:MAG: hypothetical protein LBL13_10045 [Bacteroidales bacterium]|jgi:hypothetical protein|nr:hypothetical protein [Bacteroidales bacterium]
MSNEDKILQLVLSDSNLGSFYKYDSSDFQTIEDALDSDNPIIVSVAKIIRGVNENSNKSNQKEIYNEVFNYLNNNVL